MWIVTSAAGAILDIMFSTHLFLHLQGTKEDILSPLW